MGVHVIMPLFTGSLAHYIVGLIMVATSFLRHHDALLFSQHISGQVKTRMACQNKSIARHSPYHQQKLPLKMRQQANRNTR